MLWREREVSFAVSTLWRFFERHKITLKKSRRTPQSRSARM
jgi:transposase